MVNPPTPSGVWYQLCSLDAAQHCCMSHFAVPFSPDADQLCCMSHFAVIVVYVCILRGAPIRQKLTKMTTVGTVTTVEIFDPNIYSVGAHMPPSAAPFTSVITVSEHIALFLP